MATNVTYELQGAGLDDLVGASVEVTGNTFDTAAAAGASKVMSVSDIHRMSLSEIRGNSPTTPSPGTPGARLPQRPRPLLPAKPSFEWCGAGSRRHSRSHCPSGGDHPRAASSPTCKHNDTAKILVIVGRAAGAVVGVAFGLGGGKSSTVSPE